MKYEAMFTPIKIRGLELKNRIIMPGMNTKMVQEKHTIGENLVAYHAARAAGGCGLNMFEPCAVVPEIHAPAYMGIYLDKHVEELKKITKAVHDNGGKAGVQIWHGGFAPEFFFDKTNKLQTPDTLSVDEIHQIVEAFGQAAKKAVDAGFDMLQFHAAHTYLPHEFFSPTINKRTDEYGGSFENRCRFSMEVIRAMRANMPEDMPLFMRHNAMDDLMKVNFTEDEIVEFLNMAADAGVDVMDLSRGNTLTYATVYEVPPYNFEPGFNMENIYKIRQRIKVPVVGVGRLNMPEYANKYIENGMIDLVAVGRAQLSDPEWCNKAREGREDEIRRCIACDQGCYDSIVDTKRPHITCTRNPELCFEYKKLEPAETSKKIMIVGGGYAGLMASEYMKKRGHNPVIYEASDTLGGQMNLAGAAPHKEEMGAAVTWEGETVKKMGVEIHMNTKVTPELIEQEKPDEVVIAVGSDYSAPKIEGLDQANVYTQYQVMKGEADPTGNVIVVGCGVVGSDVARLLHKRGANVTCLELKGPGNGLGMLCKMCMTEDFGNMEIKTVGGSKVYKIEGNTIYYKYTNRKTRKVSDKEREFDSVVICTGITPRSSTDLQEKCEALGIPCTLIGDAKKARTALSAAADGYKLGSTI